MISRRKLIQTASLAGLLPSFLSLVPVWARQVDSLDSITGSSKGHRFDLDIGRTELRISGKTAFAKTINGTIPGPLLRFKEGETVTLHVRNGTAAAL